MKTKMRKPKIRKTSKRHRGGVGDELYSNLVIKDNTIIAYEILNAKKKDKNGNDLVVFNSIKSYFPNKYGILKTLVIPDGITSIGDKAFLNCSSLESIEIPESVSYIGKYAFAYCNKLVSLTLPEVEIIDDYAFFKCSSLVVLSISRQDTMSIKKINKYAFSECTSLQNVTIESNRISQKDIDDTAFYFDYMITVITASLRFKYGKWFPFYGDMGQFYTGKDIGIPSGHGDVSTYYVVPEIITGKAYVSNYNELDPSTKFDASVIKYQTWMFGYYQSKKKSERLPLSSKVEINLSPKKYTTSSLRKVSSPKSSSSFLTARSSLRKVPSPKNSTVRSSTKISTTSPKKLTFAPIKQIPMPSYKFQVDKPRNTKPPNYISAPPTSRVTSASTGKNFLKEAVNEHLSQQDEAINRIIRERERKKSSM